MHTVTTQPNTLASAFDLPRVTSEYDVSVSPSIPSAYRLASPSGLRVDFNRNGSMRRFDAGGVTLNLFVGSEADGGPANLWLRRLGAGAAEATPLLGPASPTAFAADPLRRALEGSGETMGLRYRLTFELADTLPAWSWRVAVHNASDAPVDVDVVFAQDLALAPYAALRLNEYYVSQYVDHQPLEHAEHGWVVASRQNQAAAEKHPWCAIGSAGRTVAFATDALQVFGLAGRSGRPPKGVADGLPAERRQHEHSMVALQHAPVRIDAGARATLGFFGLFVDDHPQASDARDLAQLDAAVAWQRALPPLTDGLPGATRPSPSLFAGAPPLDAHDLDAATLDALFGRERRHVERAADGALLSFFHADAAHVVLREKELRVLRPHGQLLRTGRHLTPDETALTSTVWMAGAFHSMLTEGHVAINRFLSTVHGYLGFDRSHGLRVCVDAGGRWQRLDVPSAFEMTPDACRWIYRHASGVIEVTSDARSDPHALNLAIDVREGAPLRCLLALHVALGGDDGSAPGAARVERDGDAIVVTAPPASDVGRRFPHGSFRVVPAASTRIERIGGDELLYVDDQARGEPFVCVVTAPSRRCEISLHGRLVETSPDVPTADIGTAPLATKLRFAPPAGAIAQPLLQLADMLPWLRQNALVHYLSPRGLEQYSGGGWGTRDVCQGPLELLLAFGDVAPVRDLLSRVMRAQSRDGDWPQWFMFFERERAIRAGDSHGDIVFWPLLALAQYLLASGDAAFLDEPLPFFDDEAATVWQHAERALALIGERTVAGTALAAYGHGDWNDALQPADPALRERMCSAWTVTLHHQTLATLARALRAVGRDTDAMPLERDAEAVRADFRRLLIADGVLTGYALFDGADVRYLLHPRDAATGVHYSALAMIHAIDADLFTPDEARAHLRLIDEQLRGPDGVRLFDRPLAYQGGIQRLFQRAESASFFGREIGLMYMHAHLRYAQALAHVGDAAAFFDALSLVHPIGIGERVPQATPRQANCYYSSSDAAFRDRYEASAAYHRIFDGQVALDGGWRVYSSGAGIALHLVVGHLLGLRLQARVVELDPVMPPALDGLRVAIELDGVPLEIAYAVTGSGAGVSSVELDGMALPFERAANPHRPGAARIDRARLEAALRRGARRLRIGVGSAAAQ
jgi:cellobiose phosphorylase